MKTMSMRLLMPTLSALLTACAGMPIGESPIEEAQRRMPVEAAPVLVADGCLYRRHLTAYNHYLVMESRQLGEDGAKEVIAGFKEYGKVGIRQMVVPLMCATDMPPRGDDKKGFVSPEQDSAVAAVEKPFPQPLNDTVAKDAALLAAYSQLFAACDDSRYRKEDRYDCPLLAPAQAALLKARLKTSYLVVLSVGGDRASPANRTAGMMLGLLLGFINIPGDEGTARVRVVNLDTGNLVYSSFPGEFRGQSPADIYYDIGGGRSRYEDLKITEDWVKRMVKPFFEKQR